MHAKILMSLMLVGLVVAVPACSQQDGRTGPAAGTPRQTDARADINWNQLKTGMDAVEVLTLLDQPVDIKVTKINTTWYYSTRGTEGPYVVFDTRSMRVDRWRAPS